MHFIPRFRFALTAALALCMTSPSRCVIGQQPETSPAASRDRVRTVLAHALPPLDGKRLKVSLVEVRYSPGESSPAHSHPCPVVGYVIEGSIRTQVKGGPEIVVHAGESFYEAPNGVHQVSANASQSEPARFLAYFVCDNDAPLSSAVPHTGGEGEE